MTMPMQAVPARGAKRRECVKRGMEERKHELEETKSVSLPDKSKSWRSEKKKNRRKYKPLVNGTEIINGERTEFEA